MSIFLVWGSCGEYSDREDWVVAAYRDRPQAEEHCRRANLAMERWKKLSYETREDLVHRGMGESQMPAWLYDPLREVSPGSYGVCLYGVVEVPLLDQMFLNITAAVDEEPKDVRRMQALLERLDEAGHVELAEAARTKQFFVFPKGGRKAPRIAGG